MTAPARRVALRRDRRRRAMQPHGRRPGVSAQCHRAAALQSDIL